MTRLTSRHGALTALVCVWGALYVPLAVLSYLTLRANAFDLSVFDYALWSTAQGRPGFVPFMGHSLLSHHAMPSLWLLWPAYALVSSPAFLIGAQIVAAATAAILLYRIALPLIDRRLTFALVAAFLFSRRSHSAIASVFYIESFEPLLIFTAVLAITSGRRWLYWLAVVVALGCKEDMALYLGAFGLLLIARGDRRRGALTTLTAGAWLALALLVIIPGSRRADGLPPTNPFLEARYGEADDSPVGGAVERVFSGRSASRVVSLLSAAGLVGCAAPGWLLVAAPGVLANLAARPDSAQSGSIGHYAWPILPWIFLAAVFGARKLTTWKPRVTPALAALLMLWTVADSPLWAAYARGPWKTWRAAAAVRAELGALPIEGRAVVQPNLIPHLPHRFSIEAAGRELHSDTLPDLIVLSDVGDLWPLGPDGVALRVHQLSQDPRYESIPTVDGLHVFEKRKGNQPPARP